MAYSAEKLSEEKVFKDPVHRYVHVRDLRDLGFNWDKRVSALTAYQTARNHLFNLSWRRAQPLQPFTRSL